MGAPKGLTRRRAVRRTLYSVTDIPRAVLDRLGIDRTALPSSQIAILRQHVKPQALKSALRTKDMDERSRLLLTAIAARARADEGRRAEAT